MQKTEQINIDECDVKQIKDSTNIEEEYIKESIERQRADEFFRKSEVDETDADDINKFTNYISDLKTFGRFLIRCVYMRPTVPNFATVTDVRSPQDSNYISIKTETEYPVSNGKKYKKEKEIFSKTFKLYNNPKDNEIIQRLLEYSNVSKPTQLIDKKIPIKPDQKDIHHKKTPFEYSIDLNKSDMSFTGKIYRKYNRVMMRLNCYERSSMVRGHNSNGEFRLNKNILLYFSMLSILPTLFTSIAFFDIMFTVSFISYSILLIINIIFGSLEFILDERDERSYVKQKLNK